MTRVSAIRVWCACLWLGCCVNAAGAEQRGNVVGAGIPLPGAVVTAQSGDRTVTAVTDEEGRYRFGDLASGPWRLHVEMSGFASVSRDVRMGPDAPPQNFQLTMLPMPSGEAPVVPAEAVAAPPDTGPADSVLIAGSVNNGASSSFGQSAAFGNHRRGPAALYNGNIGVTLNRAETDARPFSLTGQDTARPAYTRMTGLLGLGGPLRIPHLLWQNGPNFTLNYQWTRNRGVTTEAGRVPTAAERAGDFSDTGAAIVDPWTGLPFPGGVLPASRVSPQATALLGLYPLPDFAAGSRYNYQTAASTGSNQDNWQTRLTQTLSRTDQLFGSFAGRSLRGSASGLLGFLDTNGSFGINSSVGWRHLFTTQLSSTVRYEYSRLATSMTPFFAGRRNVSAEAGIEGNNQDPANWGPPNLLFGGGASNLTEPAASDWHDQTHALTFAVLWNRDRHSVAFGAEVRRQQFNRLSQQDPRGTFAFTGAATGSDVAAFLLGLPQTASLAYGNADKYFRGSLLAVYWNDDFRVSPGLTLSVGVRWDYATPMVEKYGRLVNLEIAPGFAAVRPRLGTERPGGLVDPDRSALQPRMGIAWRPSPTSSLVLRAGYGVYYNTGVYLPLAAAMSQQAPFSRSFSVETGAAVPLTLADGFVVAAASSAPTYAVDRGFRIGYAQNWTASVQSDLPAGATMTAGYLGIKGTHGEQQILPNTYPPGGENPCGRCPANFTYLLSGGNSTRQAAYVEARRRLSGGVSASVRYTWSKSIDNGVPPSANSRSAVLAAQNWRDLGAERALSDFDQRHLLSVGTDLASGGMRRRFPGTPAWLEALARDWTLSAQMTAGSGMPQTPVYFAAVNGTGVTGTLRPDVTGMPVAAAPSGLFLNPAAFSAPAAGRWGNAGRNSIVGPRQFTLNASVGRAFGFGDRRSLEVRVDSTNALNHPVFSRWNTIVNGAQFGLPAGTNPMRSLQSVIRFRF